MMRRTRLRSMSAKRRAALPDRRVIRQAVFARDGGCVVRDLIGMPDCAGPLTPHHLEKSSHGGPYTQTNLVTLCAGHNTWVEDHPLVAHQMGLVVRAGECVSLAWQRMHVRGIYAGPM